jgi:chromate transporter
VNTRGPLSEVAFAFLRLGFLAFGGPAAHIALMEDEFVERRKWLERQHFLDLVGATNLIPGPNSTEMTIHIGYERAGWRGLFTAGICFIFPAVFLSALLGWVYVEYGALPQVEPFFVGLKPAVLAVIAFALWKLGKKAVKGWRFAAIGLGVALASLSGSPEIWTLLTGGIWGCLWLRAVGYDSRARADCWLGILFLSQTRWGFAAPALGAVVAKVSLPKLFLFFLKVGAVLYGSGYVLVAFLEGGLVHELGWLTQAQLLDAIAIGQFTPGPVLSTSSFIGYVLAGPKGAAMAALGIFLPSFFFVWILNPAIPKFRNSLWLGSFLDAVNVAAVGLMLSVLVELGQATLTTWTNWLLLGGSLVALRYKVPAVWVVVGCAALGWLLAF